VESDRPAAKPVGVLDVGEFWQPLLALFGVTFVNHILKAKNRELTLADAARRSAT